MPLTETEKREIAEKVLELDGFIVNVFNTASGTHVALKTALRDIGREQNAARARDNAINTKLDAILASLNPNEAPPI